MMKISREKQFFDRMAEILGSEEADQLLQALAIPAPKAVRYNSRRCSCTGVELKGEVVPWNTPYGRYWHQKSLPSRSLEYAAGQYYIQEASAMAAVATAARVINFQDKIVLDMTAAPGGKSTQVAELLGHGYLLANEVISKRVSPLTWNILRHRLDNVIITSLPTARLAAQLPGFFDVVMVDAPCSGEGLFQKGKHSIQRWSEKNVLFCARRQTAILGEALGLIRPGGYLVYSTCTFAKEENEDQVKRLLEWGCHPVPLPGDLPLSPALGDDERVSICSRRIFPHRQRGAGAFVAVLQKDAGSHAQGRGEVGDDTQYKEHETPILSGKVGEMFGQTLDMAHLAQGYLFERAGIVSYFPVGKIPVYLYRESIQAGVPLFDRRRGNNLMFGAVQFAAPDAVIEVSREEAVAYIEGKDIELTGPGGEYFVSHNGMVLGPVKKEKNRIMNQFPQALRPLHGAL